MFENFDLWRCVGGQQDILGLEGGSNKWLKKQHSKEQHKLYFFTKYYSEFRIKVNEMERTCGTYWGEEKCIQYFGGEN